MDYLREVVIDDSWASAAELEAQMQHVVDTYQCEWKTAVTTPEVRRRFRTFVNSDRGRRAHRLREGARPDPTRAAGRTRHRPAAELNRPDLRPRTSLP
jgi:nitrite reductase (NADH) large subunit